jgi:hypothetical protein
MITDVDFDWLIGIVGSAAAEEFSTVYADWRKEQKDSIYDTALLMFAAGYLARRNDELIGREGDGDSNH